VGSGLWAVGGEQWAVGSGLWPMFSLMTTHFPD
jgi:hypothetical protein